MVTILAVTYGLIGIMPFFVGDSVIIMRILTMVLIWSIVASCWDVIMGFAGIFSFGQVAFFVVGAYSSAILSVSLNVPPVAAMLMAGIITAMVGVLVGFPCIKLAGPYVALVTFAFHMALKPFFSGPLGKAIGSGGKSWWLIGLRAGGSSHPHCRRSSKKSRRFRSTVIREEGLR